MKDGLVSLLGSYKIMNVYCPQYNRPISKVQERNRSDINKK